MNINKIKINNFRGKNFDFTPKKINVMLHHNGYGKTSVIDAVRYGTTGLAPKDAVKNMSVKMEICDGLEIERSVSKTSVCKINGSRVTLKALDEAIEQKIGIPLDTVKICSSSDILLNLNPADFMNLLIDYIPEELTFDKVMNFFPNVTDDIRSECFPVFPFNENFGIDELVNVYNHFYETRRNEKASYQAKKSMFDRISAVKPQRTLEEIDRDISELLSGNKDENESFRIWKDYEEKKKKRDEQDRIISELKSKLKEVTDTIPTESQLNIIMTKRAEAEKSKLTHTSLLSTANRNIELYTETLKNLNSSVCPLSGKLVCTTDKTKAKSEIEHLLDENVKAAETHKKMISHADQLIAKCDKNKQIYDELKKKYDEFQKISAQIKAYEANLVIVPQKPETVKTDSDKDALKKKLDAERKNYTDYMEKKKLYEEMNAHSENIKLWTEIIDAFSDKGVVKEKIIEYYLSFFQELCNKRAADFGDGYQIRFAIKNGIHVFVKTPGNNGFVSVRALSSGERIIALFIIADMLNQMSGSGLLFIDNIEALDSGSVEKLINVINTDVVKGTYDHIFICGVDHEDIMKVFLPLKEHDDVLFL